MTQSFTRTHTRAVKQTCTRRLQFCSGHRVLGHESKCAHLHGHNYVVLVRARMDQEITGKALDSIGRVIDFSVLKEKLGAWIDKNWDHGFILHRDDAAGQSAMAAMNLVMQRDDDTACFVQKVYTMDLNPTAENMAHHLLVDICPVLFMGTNIIIEHVRIWETENCYSDAELAGSEEGP